MPCPTGRPVFRFQIVCARQPATIHASFSSSRIDSSSNSSFAGLRSTKSRKSPAFIRDDSRRTVVTGLLPAVHVLFPEHLKEVDARDKRGHDESQCTLVKNRA